MAHPPLHRAYRRLSLPPTAIGWSIALGLLPELALLAFAGRIVSGHSQLVVDLLRWVGIPVSTVAGTAGALRIIVPSITPAPAAHQTWVGVLAIVTALWFLASLLPLSRVTPGRVIFGLASFVTCVSATYFYFAGHRFPYSAAGFAELWTRAELVVWLLIPILFATTLSPLPLNRFLPMFYGAVTTAYAIWFSVVRLALLLALFHFGGMVWAAPAYFIFGFLVDFVFIVGFYAIAVGRTARGLRRAQEVWTW